MVHLSQFRYSELPVLDEGGTELLLAALTSLFCDCGLARSLSGRHDI